MADLVRQLYELGIVDASFIGLDSTPIMANTKQNNPKSFAKSKFSKENHPKSDPDCALGVHSASNQHNERRYEFYWGYKSHVLVEHLWAAALRADHAGQYHRFRRCR